MSILATEYLPVTAKVASAGALHIGPTRCGDLILRRRPGRTTYPQYPLGRGVPRSGTKGAGLLLPRPGSCAPARRQRGRFGPCVRLKSVPSLPRRRSDDPRECRSSIGRGPIGISPKRHHLTVVSPERLGGAAPEQRRTPPLPDPRIAPQPTSRQSRFAINSNRLT